MYNQSHAIISRKQPSVHVVHVTYYGVQSGAEWICSSTQGLLQGARSKELAELAVACCLSLRFFSLSLSLSVSRPTLQHPLPLALALPLALSRSRSRDIRSGRHCNTGASAVSPSLGRAGRPSFSRFFSGTSDQPINRSTRSTRSSRREREGD